MIAYRATLDVSRELAMFVAQLLAHERWSRGTRRGTRVLTCFWQAVLGLRWFRDGTEVPDLARDLGISRATGYRYRDEVVGVLAEHAPDPHEALQQAKDNGMAYVILDGKVFATDRCAEKTTSVKGRLIDACRCWCPAQTAPAAADGATWRGRGSPGRPPRRTHW